MSLTIGISPRNVIDSVTRKSRRIITRMIGRAYRNNSAVSESINCGVNQVQEVLSIGLEPSLLITPTSYSEGFIHAVLPGTYGPQLITNGNFSTGDLTGWTTTGVVAVVSNQVTMGPLAGTSLLYQSILTTNHNYRVQFNVVSFTGTVAIINNSGSVLYTITSIGIKSFTFTHTDASPLLLFRSLSGATATLDNISVIEDLTGDLTVTRASNAKRRNAYGHIEDACYNLATYSNDFTNASYVKTNTTITPNAILRPNGINYGSLVTMTADAGGSTRVYKDITLGKDNVISVSFKANTANTVRFFLLSTLDSVDFDLSTGTMSNELGDAVGSITSEGDGWYKCSMYSPNATTRILLYIGRPGSELSGSSMYMSEFQVVKGFTEKTYFKTTDRLNVPRLNYPIGGGCPHWLFEPQRTNLFTYSNDFNNAAWSKTQSGLALSPVVTSDYTIAPDGTQNADRVVFDVTAGGPTDFSQLSVAVSPTVTIGLNYTSSIWIKSNTVDDYVLMLKNVAGASAPLINVTSEWTRVDTSALATGTSGIFRLRLRADEGTSLYADVSIYQAQLEQGNYVTSEIITNGSSATRLADVCTKTGISSLIGQTEGTILLDLNVKKPVGFGVQSVAVLRPSSGSFISIYITNTGFFSVDFYPTGTYAFSLSSGTAMSIGQHKIAVAYEQGNYALCIDGVVLATSSNTSSLSTTKSVIEIRNTLIGSTNSYKLYLSRLTNTELISRTTL